MIERNAVINYLVEIINSKKKIKDNNVDKYVNVVMNYIEFFNSLDEFKTSIDGRVFSDVMILNEFAPWILPRSVRFDPSNISTKDLLVRPVIDDFKFNYEEYVLACNNIRRCFKSDISGNVTNLDSLRIHKSLNDVMPYITIEMKDVPHDDEFPVYGVRYMNTSFIPIEVDSSLECLFRNDYFNAEANILIADYINYMNFY
jgi:hypothetical protein